MRLKPQKFVLEDFPDQRSWLGNLFSPLNQFLNDVFQAFNNQLTIGDNLFQEIKEIKFKNTANDYPYKFQTKFNVIPRGLTCIYLFDNDLGAFAAETPLIVWSYANQEITISSIQGLTTDESYTIRLHIIYG